MHSNSQLINDYLYPYAYPEKVVPTSNATTMVKLESGNVVTEPRDLELIVTLIVGHVTQL